MSKLLRVPCRETILALQTRAAAFGFDLQALRGRSKCMGAVAARAVCYEYLATTRGWSSPQIGAYFNRDHTTVLWSLNGEATERKRQRMAQRYQERRP